MGVVASLVLLGVLLATVTTPGQAAAQRAIPVLPPPTTTVTKGPRPGVVEVPPGAVVSDQHHHRWVQVWTTGSAPRRVEVHKVGSERSGSVEVTSTGLEAGDLVVLVAEDQTDVYQKTGGQS